MGWWPFGSNTSSHADTSTTGAAPPTSTSRPSELLPPVTSTAAPTKPRTREEQADAELNAFLASFESASQTSPEPSDSSAPTAPASTYPPSPAAQTSANATPPPSAADPSKPDITPYALRPRSMSCRQAFDQAFYCASLGGKFNDIYRFGSLQPCSEQWDAFWFCMRTKSYGAEKGEYIARYYEDRERREMQRRSGGRTSEDVWEMRTVPVEKAFWRVP